ncbi:hypothetical protein F2Q70_00006475 [Brassica cretica]|uniref:Neprosin domain-containing protein n=1 Tax=Brassica cretica TaxID=69181 RepID=A0A8S9J3K6_BRACR|nr:hypothetical protein F2Q70_00006475 [Brassica cretica]
MGFKVCIFLLLGCLLQVPERTMARDMKRASIVIQGASRIAETDENFVCATLDWWPHDKCNYDNCPWGYSSVINMDLSRPLLTKAIQGRYKAFVPLPIAIVTFGLNALHGRHKLRGKAWGGAWNHVNTQDFINYTVSNGYVIDSWEFGKH